MVPSSPSSPRKSVFSNISLYGINSSDMRTAIAIARSKPVPSFLMSAGERFTVIFFAGIINPVFLRAERTLSLASLTDAAR